MGEIWKDVVGFETKYEVSSLGRVRVAATGLTRKPQPTYKGYLVVKLAPLEGGSQRTKSVHSMVAEAFLGERTSNAQVNHKDGDKHNNCLSNLEWVTPKENMRHAFETGLSKYGPGNPNPAFCGPKTPQRGERNYNAKLSEADATVIVQALKSGAETGVEIAKRFGVSTSPVHAIKKRRRWGHLW